MSSAGHHLWHSTAVIVATIAIVGFASWTTLALWFQAPGGAALRGLCIAGWLAFAFAALLALHRGHATLAVVTFAVAFAGVLYGGTASNQPTIMSGPTRLRAPLPASSTGI